MYYLISSLLSYIALALITIHAIRLLILKSWMSGFGVLMIQLIMLITILFITYNFDTYIELSEVNLVNLLICTTMGNMLALSKKGE